MLVSRILPTYFLLALGLPPVAAAQARLEVRFPESARVRVERLGTVDNEPAEIGAALVPGDILTTADTGFVELRCPPASDNTYRLIGPFRVLLDVPRESRCHINLLAGDLNVLSEEPTEQTVGAVTLVSSGTQYAVVARQAADARTATRVIVFDGNVRMRVATDSASAPARAGMTVVWDGMRFDRAENSPAQLQRWSGLYARFDTNAALRRGAVPPGRVDELYARLDSLHYEVLSRPGDIDRRVALARALLVVGETDQARYNLARVGIVSDSALRRYDIDPYRIRRNR